MNTLWLTRHFFIVFYTPNCLYHIFFTSGSVSCILFFIVNGFKGQHPLTSVWVRHPKNLAAFNLNPKFTENEQNNNVMIPNQSITSISINRGKCLMQVLLYKKIHFVPVMTFPLTSTYMNFNLQLVSKPHIIKSYYLLLHNSIFNSSQVNPLL